MKDRKLYLWLPVLAAVLLFLSARPAMAAGELRQTNYATHSISVGWEDMTETIENYKNAEVRIFAYEIRWYDASGTMLGKSNQLKPTKYSYYIKGLSANNSYKVKLRIGYRIIKTGKSVTSAMQKTMFTIPGSVKIKTYNHRSDQKGLQLRWTPVSGSNPVRYEYQITSPAGKKLTSGTTSGSGMVIQKFKYYNRAVKIRMRAYVTDSSLTKHYGAWSSFKAVVPQPILYTDTAKYGVLRDGTLKLKWDRVIHATRYEVWISTTSAKTGYHKAGSVPATGGLTMTVSVPTWNGTDKFEMDTVYYIMVLTNTKAIGRSAKNYYMSCELSTKK